MDEVHDGAAGWQEQNHDCRGRWPSDPAAAPFASRWVRVSMPLGADECQDIRHSVAGRGAVS